MLMNSTRMEDSQENELGLGCSHTKCGYIKGIYLAYPSAEDNIKLLHYQLSQKPLLDQKTKIKI